MTLDLWLKAAGNPHVWRSTVGVVSIHDDDIKERWELHHLDDYAVHSRGGGTTTLVPRSVREQAERTKIARALA